MKHISNFIESYNPQTGFTICLGTSSRTYVLSRAFFEKCWIMGIICLCWWSFLILQFSSVTQSCLTLCDPMNCSAPGHPVHHQLPEPTQIHVLHVSDAIQPSHPLSAPFPSTFNLSQHQGLFQWVSSSHQVATVLEFQLQHQSFQWTGRTDLL